MRRCWSGSRTPIEWYQNKLLSSHLQAADVQNATNKVTFAKSTPSDAFYYTCTSNGLVKTNLFNYFPKQGDLTLKRPGYFWSKSDLEFQARTFFYK